MALATYSDLQTALGTWANNRTDLPTADLVTLAEARLNRDLYGRLQEHEAALTGVIGSRFVALPSDYLEPRKFWWEIANAGRRELEFVVPERMPNWANSAPVAYWTVDGSNVAFERPVDQAYNFTFRYLQKFALSNSVTTNWLLTAWPDAYLAAANVEAALWLQDDDQAGRWQARYEAAVAQINSVEGNSRDQARLRADPAIQAGFTRRSRFNVYSGY